MSGAQAHVQKALYLRLWESKSHEFYHLLGRQPTSKYASADHPCIEFRSLQACGSMHFWSSQPPCTNIWDERHLARVLSTRKGGMHVDVYMWGAYVLYILIHLLVGFPRKARVAVPKTWFNPCTCQNANKFSIVFVVLNVTGRCLHVYIYIHTFFNTDAQIIVPDNQKFNNDIQQMQRLSTSTFKMTMFQQLQEMMTHFFFSIPAFLWFFFGTHKSTVADFGSTRMAPDFLGKAKTRVVFQSGTQTTQHHLLPGNPAERIWKTFHADFSHIYAISKDSCPHLHFEC